MAKKSMIQKEIKRQKLVNKYTDKRKKIKKTIKETTNDFEKQIRFQQELQKLPRDSSPCKLRNRCWVTGRSRGVYRDFGLSRHVFREMAHECLLPGVTKSSW